MGSSRSSASQTAGHPNTSGEGLQASESNEAQQQQQSILPTHNEKAPVRRKMQFRVESAGESGRRGINLLQMLVVSFKSTCTLSMIVNILWPFVPAAIAIHFARPESHVWVFTLNYIGMTRPHLHLLSV